MSINFQFGNPEKKTFGMYDSKSKKKHYICEI